MEKNSDFKLKKIVSLHKICRDAVEQFFIEHPYLSVNDKRDVLKVVQKAFNGEVALLAKGKSEDLE